MSSVLKIENLSKSFVSKNGREVLALSDLSLTCEAGNFLCILGPTGCGKTTLLRLIAGLEEPSSGDILFDDALSVTKKHDTGFVFQQNSLFPWRTVLKNVSFGLEMRGWKKSDALNRAGECLKMVRLEGVEKAYPYELSGGMQQRVSIARAIALSPSLLLLDEPFGSLDEKTRKIMQNEILDLWNESGMTIIFVTHNIEEAILLGQRVLILDLSPGRIAAEILIDLPYPRNRLSNEFVNHLLKSRELFDKIVS